MLIASQNRATLSDGSGSLYRIAESQAHAHHEAHTWKQMAAAVTELGRCAQSSGNSLQPAGWKHLVEGLEEPADWIYREVPGSSIYLQDLRISGEIAVNSAKLLIASRFICNFERHFNRSNNKEMHI